MSGSGFHGERGKLLGDFILLWGVQPHPKTQRPEIWLLAPPTHPRGAWQPYLYFWCWKQDRGHADVLVVPLALPDAGTEHPTQGEKGLFCLTARGHRPLWRERHSVWKLRLLLTGYSDRRQRGMGADPAGVPQPPPGDSVLRGYRVFRR